MRNKTNIANSTLIKAGLEPKRIINSDPWWWLIIIVILLPFLIFILLLVI